MKDSEIDEHATISGLTIWYVGLGVGLLVAVGLLSAWMRPVWLGFERDAFVASHQYVESHKTKIHTLMEKHDELGVQIAKYKKAEDDDIVTGLQAQQKSLARRIRASAIKIPEDTRPLGTERFMK